MKKKKWIGITIGTIAVLTGVVLVCFGGKIKTIYVSLNSFKDENLAHTFQHTPEIQPTKKISKGSDIFQFAKEDNAVLADSFDFEGTAYPTEQFMEDTKTSAMIVIKDDVIKYEQYFSGGDENTLFSSNSMGKSFVSALMGIAVSGVLRIRSGNISRNSREPSWKISPSKPACRWLPESISARTMT